MFRRRTLIVIGAGASHEAGLPCGADLVLEISNKLDIRFRGYDEQYGAGDLDLFDSVTNLHRGEETAYQRGALLIRDGIHLSNSIDDFLDLHQNDRHTILIGKAAIVKCILEAERSSSLHFDDSNIYNSINFRALHATWFVKFTKMLGRGVTRDKAHEIFDNVSFVVFNYDRCLELFLHHAVRRLYGLSEQDAGSICSKARIIHPYGMVAPLRISSGMGVPFGHTQVNCGQLAGNIKTYTEQVLAEDELATIRQEVAEAKCIVFLGCKFHEPNMRMLAPLKPIKPIPVFSTSFGISDDDADNIRAVIGSLFVEGESRTIRWRPNLKCADLFDNFSTSLAG